MDEGSPETLRLERADETQRAWANKPIQARVAVLRRWRHATARQMDALTAAVNAAPLRTPADVRVSEILPLLAACEFLEKNAAALLKPRRLGRSGRPMWLSGVSSEVERVALGRVLVIGPSNYPLFLPGVQVLQALVAGNAVTWKPGAGGRAVASLVVAALKDAGIPHDLLELTEESVEAGEAAIEARPDKVFFTGSASSGRAVMRMLAETGTPSVMELSGCSAVVVTPNADLGRVTDAIVFGMRLNGAATCMAPRRLLMMRTAIARRDAFIGQLEQAWATIHPVHLSPKVQVYLWDLVEEARAHGAIVRGSVAVGHNVGQAPLLLLNVRPEMRIAQSDIFAPVLSVIDVADETEMLAAESACPFALSVSIFGEEFEARRMAARMTVGTVVINDLIVPTADPRIPFGGRRSSGYGVTRGAEGLLEMTAVKTVLARRGSNRRHFEATSAEHTGLFDGLIEAGHGETWMERWGGLRKMVKSASRLRAQASAGTITGAKEAQREQNDGV